MDRFNICGDGPGQREEPYRCPQCDTNQRDYPMLLGHNPRALCAHYSHKAFYDFAWHGVKHIKHIKHAAIVGFVTGFAVGGFLIWHLVKG